MQSQHDTLAREERLAAARKTLSKYQNRIKELKTTASPASAEPSISLPFAPASEEKSLEVRATTNRESVRGRKDSLSSSTVSTATNSSQFSFLGDNQRTEPLRGDVADGANVLEAALDFDDNDAIAAGNNSPAAADSSSKLQVNLRNAGENRDAVSKTSNVTEEELRRINLMYNQICVQLEQKAQEEESLRNRIEGLSSQLDDRDAEVSKLNAFLSGLSLVVESGGIATSDVNSKNAVDFESQLANALRKLESVQNESKTWHDSCNEWMEKCSQLQASFSEVQRQNLIRENEVGQQLAEMHRLLEQHDQERSVSAVQLLQSREDLEVQNRVSLLFIWN